MTLQPGLLQARRILAVRLDNVGDVVMLSPALRALREACPAAAITLLASPAGAQVAPLLPWVDDVIARRTVWQEFSPDAGFGPAEEQAFISELAARRFDAALVFTSFSQSPYPPAYCCYLAGVPVRAGESKEFGGQLLTHRAPSLPDSAHQVERNLHLLESLGVPVKARHIELDVPARAKEAALSLLHDGGIDPDEPFIALAPGASCMARRYEEARFLQAGLMLAQETRRKAVVLGTAKEEALFGPLLPPGAPALFGRTSVPELAAIIQAASLVVCNNSAALHLADAFARPVVAFYAGTDLEEQWRPRRAPSLLLRRETHCAPCYRLDCPYERACLEIAPEEAVEMALGFLDGLKAQEAVT